MGVHKKAKGKSIHINRRHFCMMDMILNREIQLKYMPTKEMIAGVFTKSLHSKLFFQFRDALGLKAVE